MVRLHNVCLHALDVICDNSWMHQRMQDHGCVSDRHNARGPAHLRDVARPADGPSAHAVIVLEDAVPD